MRIKSGNVKDNSKIVLFLYILGRDYLPLGSIESIMNEIDNLQDDTLYTNGWLAKWAQDVKERLREKDREINHELLSKS